jgi:hypothetical protein
MRPPSVGQEECPLKEEQENELILKDAGEERFQDGVQGCPSLLLRIIVNLMGTHA